MRFFTKFVVKKYIISLCELIKIERIMTIIIEEETKPLIS
jgi:hypothetical protein